VWSDALAGLLYALPSAGVVAAGGVTKGLAFAVGLIPACVLGIAVVRRQRVRVVVLGALAGASLFVGAVLGHVAWLAVVGIFGLSVMAAELARRRPLGQVAMVLMLPLVAIGSSFRDLHEAAGLALIMTAGSAYAWVISLLWPDRPAAPPPPLVSPPSRSYGVRLGLAAAVAATIGFALDLDHVGWAPAAALLVMRPSADMQELRSLGRVASVVVGAGLAAVLADVTSSPTVYAIATMLAVTAASATHTSRWYVTAAFTTFLAISLLVYAQPGEAWSRFDERVAETLLGVGLAYLFGLALPSIARRRSVRA
jgi:hypothetical protein